ALVVVLLSVLVQSAITTLDISPYPDPFSNAAIVFNVDFDNSGPDFKHIVNELGNWPDRTNQSDLSERIIPKDKLLFGAIGFTLPDESNERVLEMLNDISTKICDFAPFRVPIDTYNIGQLWRIAFHLQTRKLGEMLVHTLFRHGFKACEMTQGIVMLASLPEDIDHSSLPGFMEASWRGKTELDIASYIRYGPTLSVKSTRCRNAGCPTIVTKEINCTKS
ncbi:hypothetical protein PENTCL1PPCAC_539, partial [Pristionchus entomophagus]